MSSAWFLVFAYMLAFLVGVRLFQMWAYLESPPVSESSPVIPSEMDDWDAEFKERTGQLPELPRPYLAGIRVGEVTTTWSVPAPVVITDNVPGDVIHHVASHGPIGRPRWYGHAANGALESGEL